MEIRLTELERQTLIGAIKEGYFFDDFGRQSEMKVYYEGYFEFEEKKISKRRRVEIVKFVVNGNLIELIIRGNFRGYYEEIPMVYRIEGDKFLWSMKQDEDGCNLYEDFPYKVTDVKWESIYRYEG